MAIYYDCQRCTACCRWPGQVRLTDDEVARLAEVKGLIEFDFIQQFTRLRDGRRGLALQDKSDGTCIFLDGDDCSVQPVKPQQCRDFRTNGTSRALRRFAGPFRDPFRI